VCCYGLEVVLRCSCFYGFYVATMVVLLLWMCLWCGCCHSNCAAMVVLLWCHCYYVSCSCYDGVVAMDIVDAVLLWICCFRDNTDDKNEGCDKHDEYKNNNSNN